MAARDLTAHPVTSIAPRRGIPVVRPSDRGRLLRLAGDPGRLCAAGSRRSPGNVLKAKCVKTADVNPPTGPAYPSDGSGYGPEVRSGDVPQPIMLKAGEEFNFTIRRGVNSENTVSVNYDDFVNDVEVGDTLLIDGGMMSLSVKEKTEDTVKCKVIDGGELKSRRHLNVRGKSATLPSITEKDWEDIKFGVDNKVDFYAVSFVKDAKVVHELKDYLKSCESDIHVTVKIESADSIPNLHSIISASDGEEIIRKCRSMGKPVIVATNMLESMINHPTPTRAEVSDIAIAVRQGADAGDTSAMFAYHTTTMANTLGTPVLVFTRTGSMATLLSHYRPFSTVFAFTNQERVKQRLALYHGVFPIYMEFSDDAEETFSRALSALVSHGLLKEGSQVTLVQSGTQPIWREESTHHIQVRKVQARRYGSI
ncbi:unnamed protein product [Victoria cruziana]